MIKKIFIIIFVITSINIFAQVDQKQNPNVELPDFVITGKDVISIESAKKLPPDFVSTLSKEYLKPAFSPEELPVKNISNPLKRNLDLNDSLNYNEGNFYFGAGLYSLPTTSFNYTYPFNHGIFEGLANGNYQRAYVTNSDRYSLGGGANLSYFINNDASFIPGTQFKLHGKVNTSSYKLFASDTPEFKRSLNQGDVSLSINNMLSKYFLFLGKLSNNYTSLSNEPFSENLFSLDGMARITFPALNVGADIIYKSQLLNDSLSNNQNYNFIKVHPKVGINIGINLQAVFGFIIASSGGNSFTSPTASLALKIDNGVALFAEYAPDADWYTSSYFLNKNDYFNINTFNNLFVAKPSQLNLIIKYEYQTYFEIDGGFKFYSSNHIPYFKTSSQSGRFDIASTEGNSGTAFINLLFHAGPYGVLYGTAEINDTRDTNSYVLPYYPKTKASFSYGYNFDNGLSTEAKLEYNSQSYSNLTNTKTVNSFIDLGLNFIYKLQSNYNLTLKISNLLNHDNYIWAGYKEVPANVVFGFNYHW